jgi:hypothetical protein
LESRGQEAKRIRHFEEAQHAQEVQKGLAEGALQSDCKSLYSSWAF